MTGSTHRSALRTFTIAEGSLMIRARQPGPLIFPVVASFWGHGRCGGFAFFWWEGFVGLVDNLYRAGI